jgi:peptidyl-dipeptidase Dcp
MSPSLRALALGSAVALGLTILPPTFASAQETAPGAIFETPSPLPFHAPQFDKIKESDFQPAIEMGMKREDAEIAAIADNPAPPTFDNTLVAMERSGRMLNRVLQVFGALAQADTDPALQKIQAEEAPRLSAHEDAIYLNPKLFARVSAVYQARASLTGRPEAVQLATVVYDQFVHAGARLSDADKAKLRSIDEQLSVLRTTFNRKLLAATKAGALSVDSASRLQGLEPAAITAAAHAAEARGMPGHWLIPLQNTTQQPDLQSLDDRATRQALFDHSWTRAEAGDANDTRATILEIARLRAQKAALLGYDDYAAYVLSNQMAKTPAAVDAFLGQLVAPTRAKIAGEARDIQAMIDRDGRAFALEPWDWEHYAEQVRKARYDLDAAEIRPYFELNDVLQNGVFYAANQLYGITFRERKDLPVYQSDVRVFEVFDKDGAPLGLFYCDYFKRDNKAGGAWMSTFVGQSKLLGNKPVVYNVANFPKPPPGQPALLTFDDVTGMFHEFGHALHGLFADEEYPTLAGTHVARDFVEFPSQFNEHWALDPKVLAHYAVNYKTGAPMPQALVDKIKKAEGFNQGYALGELLAAAELDMEWHGVAPDAAPTDVDTFETHALAATGTNFPDVPPRYRSSYFSHIWGGGYAAGYYAYLWTEMLDDDAYHWFMDHGGLTRANGQRFRDLILSRGHTEDYGPMFRAFYGKDPEIGPLLEHRGLAEPAS